MKVGLVYDPIYLRHDTGYHVENAERLSAVIDHLEGAGLKERLKPIEPRAASAKELLLVHQRQYISYIQGVAQRGGGWLDADTVVSADSYQVAAYAAGGVIRAVEQVLAGEVTSAFALVRPPGHHATWRRAMGFCLFNNVAIAAKYAVNNCGLESILIIDFDVHHGNGTQEAFYSDPGVLYVSTHQYPHYPGTGGIEETGSRMARGTTLNIPLPAGCGDIEYLRVLKEIVVPAARRFKPQLILVSAGYDAHWADGLSMMQLTVAGFAQMVAIIKELAQELCHGHLVFALEGGYELTVLASSVAATLNVLRDSDEVEDPLGESPRRFGAPDIEGLVKVIKEIHNLA